MVLKGNETGGLYLVRLLAIAIVGKELLCRRRRQMPVRRDHHRELIVGDAGHAHLDHDFNANLGEAADFYGISADLNAGSVDRYRDHGIGGPGRPWLGPFAWLKLYGSCTNRDPGRL
jgi:hypothetical protein